jgi:hypothetical protein
MNRSGYRIFTVFVLVALFSSLANSQEVKYRDRSDTNKIRNVILKPAISYSVGSSFIAIPHHGSVTGFTFSPFVSLPLSKRLSVEGGIIAGRYFSSLKPFTGEGILYGSFTDLSVFGSASYRVGPRLTLYGAGIRQVAGTSPFFSLPKSSYTLGSVYKLGDFSIGISLHMSDRSGNYNSMPFNGSQGFFSPFGQRSGLNSFGQ